MLVGATAGVAAGIDLCLHLVRRDQGAAVANRIARRMVVPPHRAGGQVQFATPAPTPGPTPAPTPAPNTTTNTNGTPNEPVAPGDVAMKVVVEGKPLSGADIRLKLVVRSLAGAPCSLLLHKAPRPHPMQQAHHATSVWKCVAVPAWSL